MTAYAVNDNGTYTALRAANDKSAYTLSFTGSRLGVFALTDLLDGELPFRDVNTGDWYYDDVRYVYENGLMNGVTTTQFAPKTDITRGMLVTILYRVEGEPVAPPANPFKDVASGSYYEAAIAWAETRGIVNGFGGGLFRPNAPITREQFVAILYRYAAYKGLQTTASASLSAFADAASVSRLGRRRGPLGRRQRPDERQERPDRPGRPHHQSRSSRPAAPLPGLSKHKKDAPKAPKRAVGASCVMYGRRFSLYDCRRAKRLL